MLLLDEPSMYPLSTGLTDRRFSSQFVGPTTLHAAVFLSGVLSSRRGHRKMYFGSPPHLQHTLPITRATTIAGCLSLWRSSVYDVFPPSFRNLDLGCIDPVGAGVQQC